MRQFHHVGVPTTTPKEGEQYLEGANLYYTDPEACPERVEWLRFEPECAMPDQLKTIPHVAFVVEDLNAAIEGKDVLIEPFKPFEGQALTIAFIMAEGAPIELMQMG